MKNIFKLNYLLYARLKKAILKPQDKSTFPPSTFLQGYGICKMLWVVRTY